MSNVVLFPDHVGEHEADATEIERFLRATFKHLAPDETVRVAIGVYSNNDKTRSVKPHYTILNGTSALPQIAGWAARFSTRAAAAGTGELGETVAVRVCGFGEEKKVRDGQETKDPFEGDDNVVFAPFIAVEMDKRPIAARRELEAVFGKPTLVVESGGVWTGDDGVPEAKRHLYWRLKEPVRENLGRLKTARARACDLVGGDGSGVSVGHPMRLPGSWHTKATQRLCRIVEENNCAEIDLDVALENVTEELLARGVTVRDLAHGVRRIRDNFRTAVPWVEADLMRAADDLPNDFDDWDRWNTIGMSFFDVSHASEEGYQAFLRWSSRTTMKEFDNKTVEMRWESFLRSPPRYVFDGSLLKELRVFHPQWQAHATLVDQHYEEVKAGESDGIFDGFSDPEDSRPVWEPLLLRDNKKVLPVLANAVLILKTDPRIRNCIAYDEMLRRPMLMRKLPGRSDVDANVSYPTQLADTDISDVQQWLQVVGLGRVGKDVTHQAIDLLARENSFHPVRDYLGALKWDGVPRLYGWLSTYFGAERKPYHDRIGAMALIAMVARVMRPGCKADYLLVLEGAQGARKSTACAILGGAWFSDGMPDVKDGKDVSQHLAGKWLIEVAEMSAMSKADHAALKAFITRTTERYRPSYGRLEVEQPRQCVFIGTTNAAAYLRDESGGRRFWPVKVNRIDAEGLTRDRDQLFAEAVSQFEAGVAWWPDAEFERNHIAPEQDSRFEADVWEAGIREWLATQTESVLIGDVARQGVGILSQRIGRADQNRITAILERIGYRRAPKDWRGNVRWELAPGAT